VNVVDSSGWLEYLADAPGADFFAPAIENTEELLVPSICLLEVARKIFRQRGEDPALQALALMQQGRVIQLVPAVIQLAARFGVEHRLPLADSVIFATGRLHDALVWTQDADFEGLEGVRYTPKVLMNTP
jgi:predicted nucleic acid-binding protein